MNTAKLERWSELLLDIGKRNNLINFHDTKSSTLEVVLPNVETLFEKASGEHSFEVYDPKLDIFDVDFLTGEVAASDLKQSAVSMSREEYIATYASACSRGNKVLLYNPKMSPISALKSIEKKSRTALEETGVNIAYMAFGFVNWKESDSSTVMMKAPILLIPVEFVNDSAVTPHFIKTAGEDIIVNPTFNYKINSEYGVKLPDYNDEDFTDYLNNIEDMVKKLGWSASRECKIGTFSFLKINMYYDLQDNEDAILENENVQILLGENTCKDITPSSADEETEQSSYSGKALINLKSVVDADSSQIEAIEMAKSGKSFVLQGPPGTGKSQTITNIIAELIGDDKTVLFVSEKQAALNVVYDKLKKAGLAEFCLELHSHKANKKAVIDELCHTLRLEKSAVSSRADSELEAKAKTLYVLDAYEDKLHKKRAVINKSLYQLFEAYSACRDADDLETYIINIEDKGTEYLHDNFELLEQYSNYVPTIGFDYRRNPWYGYSMADNSFETKASTKRSIKEAKEAYSDFASIAERINAEYGIQISNLSELLAIDRFFSYAGNSYACTPAFLNYGNLNSVEETARCAKEEAKKILGIKAIIAEQYEEDIYNLPAADYYKKLTKLYSGSFDRMFKDEYKDIINNIRLCRLDCKKPSYNEAVDIMKLILDQYKANFGYKDVEETAKSCLGNAFTGVDSDFEYILADIVKAVEVIEPGLNYGKLSQIDNDTFEAIKPNLLQYHETVQAKLADSKAALDYINNAFDSKVFDFETENFKTIVTKLTDCDDNADLVDNWYHFKNLFDRLDKADLLGFLDEAISKKIKPELIPVAYKKVFYRQWIQHVLDSEPGLPEFDRIGHDIAVSRFKEKDLLQFDINKAVIKEKLSAKRPSISMLSGGSSVAKLMREGEKKRKQMPIRKLVAECGDIIQVIKPCFMMSPLSVSTFLSAGNIHFDTIIFDEASQIFPQDAIGAIYRGSQLIVVGDAKQMPPTNFFNTSVDSDDVDDDDDVGDVADFESILDLCSSSMSRLSLNWHYRSRYEQLIAFSNLHFYDNNLTTFPSSKADEKGIGVDYYLVDGTFDRKSHTNRKEAEFIIDLIYKNIEEFPDRSLGVVAFSISQQTIIENLLWKRRQEEPDKEWFFSANQNEPFFIKNLETVQGDERDTIIFSIAYAKDSSGKLLRQFGPVSRVGGERRLNVAVTRAKENIQVVSSIRGSDIDLNGITSVGTTLIHDYLNYAERGLESLDSEVTVNPFDQFDSEFELEVCDFLRENGYSVDTQVGCSGFKIDLGLKQPDTSNYCLAIECDGASYHSSKNARDRDRLRQQILEQMGWKFYRIWSTDWFLNNATEKQRLLEACREAIESYSTVVPATGVNRIIEDSQEKVNPSFEEKMPERNLVFPKYKRVDETAYHWTTSAFQKNLRDILETEAPLSEEWLLQRICYLFGREKVTSVVRDKYEDLMYKCLRNDIVRRNGFLYINNQDEYVLRVPKNPNEEKRDLKHIAPEEIAAGMITIIEQNVACDKNGLYHTIANALGYKSVKTNATELFEKALGILLQNRIVEFDGDMLKLADG